MKDVLITISSIQNIDGRESAGPELITEGRYDFAQDGAHLVYQESALTGMTGTKTDLHVKPDEVILSRRGAVNSQMVFRRGEHSRFLYHTEYGAMTVGLNTRRLENRLGEHGGELEIEYALDFEQALLSRNRFQINVREKGVRS
jgi:uncharacterized beta-barrel protein YwiB (DUF1934 family)